MTLDEDREALGGFGDIDGAREALLATPLDPERTVVRVNAAGTPEHALDLACRLASQGARSSSLRGMPECIFCLLASLW